MREHEVPTHVQAEDKALLWFTFPQVVAVMAVCAVSYGVYRYFPFGPAGLKLGIAILLAVAGIAMTVGKAGGRGLPLVAADLLKFKLGARRYAGSPAQLAISEPPSQPEARPGPLRLLAKNAASGVSKGVKAARDRGRRIFRPHGWFGKRRHHHGGHSAKSNPEDIKTRKPWSRFLAVAALGLLTLVALPGSALADGPDANPYGDAWRLDEIYFEPPDPVPGRRVFIEKLAVSGNTARVTLRAAHGLDLKGMVFGGRTGKTLKMGFNTSLAAGQSKSYSLTLDGPSPSFTFSWVDALDRAGAVSLKSNQIPYPLPRVDGELCGLELTSLEWTPGSISGVIASECIAETRHEVDLPAYGGHFSQSVSALLDAKVTGITGTVSVRWGGYSAAVSFVPGGETQFTMPVANNRAANDLEITADLTAALNVPLPPMLQTVHHPARTDVHQRTVSLSCGEYSVSRTVVIRVHHPEHVRAVETERAPITPARSESVALAPAPASGAEQVLGLGADNPYAGLVVPPPTPEPPRAEQTKVGDSSWWGEPW